MDLLSKLKSKRKEIAEREGKELFMIFHNSTLEETIKHSPKTKENLSKIKGWGRKKIDKYGDEILALVNEDEETQAPKNEKLWQTAVKEKIFTVGEFISFVNEVIAGLGQVKIQGEISDIKKGGGNLYFRLKDPKGSEAILDCFVWRWDLEHLDYLIEEGFEVVVSGAPSVFSKNSRFNLVVKKIIPVGEGALKKAFEALKQKLAVKGYFDLERKKTLPKIVQKIGLVTSESGEAINDFMKNIGNYGFEINFFDIRVEGDYAENSAIKAVKWLNINMPNLDLIVLIRGGGSLESLKAFNSELVAEALIASKIPVITGIGHEGDETIADLVADQRFSTPTALAAFLKKHRQDLIIEINQYGSELILLLEKSLTLKKHLLISLSERLIAAFSRIFDIFEKLKESLVRAIFLYENTIQKYNHKIAICKNYLIQTFEKCLELLKNRVIAEEKSFLALNPLEVLKRGYSLVFSENGTIIKSVADTKVGERVRIQLHQGIIRSLVEKLEK